MRRVRFHFCPPIRTPPHPPSSSCRHTPVVSIIYKMSWWLRMASIPPATLNPLFVRLIRGVIHWCYDVHRLYISLLFSHLTKLAYISHPSDKPDRILSHATPSFLSSPPSSTTIAPHHHPSMSHQYDSPPSTSVGLPASTLDPEHADSDITPIKGEELDTAHTRLLDALSRETQRQNPSRGHTLLQQCIAECIGTMFIVIFGVGSVCSAIVTGSGLELWHVASIWGFGVSFAVLVSMSVSGAHLNPAVSLAFALFRPRDFPFSKLLPYMGSQYLGGVLGGAFNLMVFGPVFSWFERTQGITRGDAASVLTASAFGEYFPNPGGKIPREVISTAFAFLVEAWQAAILIFVVLSVTDPKHKAMGNPSMIPLYIGFTVGTLIAMYAPITQGGFNPARDFGPRLVAVMAGWGKIAIPGPRNGFWVYLIAPHVGGVVGAFSYDFLIKPGMFD